MNWYVPKAPEKSINGKFFCPSCKVTLLKRSRVCLVCGQSIDWSSSTKEGEDLYEEPEDE